METNLGGIDFDPWSALEYLFNGINLSKITSQSGSCMGIDVIYLGQERSDNQP